MVLVLLMLSASKPQMGHCEGWGCLTHGSLSVTQDIQPRGHWQSYKMPCPKTTVKHLRCPAPGPLSMVPDVSPEIHYQSCKMFCFGFTVSHKRYLTQGLLSVLQDVPPRAHCHTGCPTQVPLSITWDVLPSTHINHTRCPTQRPSQM